MDPREAFEQSFTTAIVMKAAAQGLRKLAEFEWIGEVQTPGGHFANHKLEQDYQMKHPFISTFHPGIYGSAALGAAIAKSVANHVGPHPGLTGAVLGGMVGMTMEAAHRYSYLMDAKRKLESGKSPVDVRYQL
jgi:hypothetical protein